MSPRNFGRKLPKTSKIGLGLSQFSNTTNKKAHSYKSKSQTLNAIKYCIKSGINFFDTSPNYGETERILGELKQNEKSKIIVATKIGLKKNGVRDFSRSFLMKELKKSLKSLRVKELDLLMLNKPSISEIKKNNLVDFLQELKIKGLIKKAGIVVGNKRGFSKIFKSRSIDYFSIFFNLLNTENFKLLEVLKKEKKKVIIRSPLNSGLLSGNINESSKFLKSDQRFDIFGRKNKDFLAKLKRISLIKKEFNINKSELFKFSMNFLILNSKINIILVGCSTKKQIIELINHINTGIDIKLDLKRITKFSDEISKKFRAKSERF